MITEERFEEIIERGIIRAFERVGLDPGNAAELRADFIHLRRWRLRLESGVNKIMLTLLGVTITATLLIMWDSFKSALLKP